MTRQKRPSGGMWIATVEWKIWVRSQIYPENPAGMTRAELAKKANVTPETITQLLGPQGGKPKESQTRAMPAINRALGATPPKKLGAPTERLDELRERLVKVWPFFDETERALIAAMTDRASKRGTQID